MSESPSRPPAGAAAPDDSAVSYPSYLRLDALLALQTPLSRPEHPDELLFIVVHQASELWFKVLLHELDALVARMATHDALGALFVVRRVNALVRIVTAQLTALDTLPPHHFAQFRGYLGSSSGSQSAQFRAIEAASGLREPHFLAALAEHGDPPEVVRRWLEQPTLQERFDAMLQQAGTSYEALYGGAQTPLLLLAEALLEYEQGFAMWRFLHVQLVERIIGPTTGGTGGTLGAKYLSRTISQRFFPKLWSVRAALFASGSGAPPPAAP